MSGNTLGDGPIDEQYEVQMKLLANHLDEYFNGLDARTGNRKTGFVLLVFPFGDGDSRCNYISNADRRDVAVLLREQLARFEGMPGGKGRA